MSGFGFVLQAAIVAALAEATPPVAGGRVYDHDPGADATYPHVVVDGGQAIPDDTTNEDGGGDAGISEFIDLHVWDRPGPAGGHRGFKRCKETAARISDILHGDSLTVAGRSSAHAFVRGTRFLSESDGLTRRAIVTVEVIHRT